MVDGEGDRQLDQALPGLAGKTVLPFVTYAISGMSGIDDDYRDALPDTDVRTGLAVQGETVADAAPELAGWLTGDRPV